MTIYVLYVLEVGDKMQLSLNQPSPLEYLSDVSLLSG